MSNSHQLLLFRLFPNLKSSERRGAPKNAPKTRDLRLESLEDRNLLSASPARLDYDSALESRFEARGGTDLLPLSSTLALTETVVSASASPVDSQDYESNGQLVTPSVSTSVLQTSVSIKIYPVSDATNYVLEYGTDPNFATFATKTYASSGTKTISGLDPGTIYYFRLRATADSFADSSDLYFNATTKFPTDSYEPNNSLATPRDLGTIAGIATLDANLNDANDVDYYRFLAPYAGRGGGYSIKLSYPQADGIRDLTLELYNGEGELIGVSRDATGTEEISLVNLPADTYTVKIYNDNPSASSYSLAISTSPVEDWLVSSNADGDSTPGTLRWAIASAQAGDRIVFAPRLKGATITLNGSELVVNKAITIDASSVWDDSTNAPGITVDGNSASRVFSLSDGAALFGLKIAKGQTNAKGGGVYTSGSVSLTDCHIVDNYVYKSDGQVLGGGIYVDGGSATLTRCSVLDNGTYCKHKYALSAGGGIYSTGALTMTNCLVRGNYSTIAAKSAHSQGGGVYSNGTANFTNCLFTGNFTKFAGSGTSTSGGAFQGAGGSANFFNCTFTGNSATSNGGDLYSGGGLQLAAGTYNLYNTIIVSNTGTNQVGGSATKNGHNCLSNVSWSNASSATNYTYNSSLPLFVNASTCDFALASGSQAIDKGDNSRVSVDKDLAERARVNNGTVDIGAFEWSISKLATPSASITPTKNAVTIKLNPTENATKFVVDYGTDPGFATYSSKTYTTSGVKTIAGLTAGTRYYLRVQALADGYVDAASNYLNLTARTTGLAVPSVTYEVGDRSVAITADEVPDATGWVVDYGPDPDFADFRSIRSTTFGTTTVDGLAFATNYYFRVKATSDEYGSSDPFLFNVETPFALATPSLTLVSADKDAISLEIGEVDGADGYVLEYSKDPNFATGVRRESFAEAGGVEIRSYFLTRDTVYYWRVKAIGDGDEYSDWATLTAATTRYRAADLALLQSLGIEPSSPRVEWTERDVIYNGVDYEAGVLVSLDCSGMNLTSLDVSKCYYLQSLDCSNNSLTELDLSELYYLRNLSCYSNNIASLKWCGSENSRTIYIDGPVLKSISDLYLYPSGGEYNEEYQWREWEYPRLYVNVAESEEYDDLIVTDDGGANLGPVEKRGGFFRFTIDGHFVANYEDGDTRPRGAFRYMKDGELVGTTCLNPEGALSAPVVTATPTSSSVVLTINNYGYYTIVEYGYYNIVEYGTDPDFATFSRTSVRGRTATISDLDPLTQYYFRVKATCGYYVDSDWSETTSVKTALPVPTLSGLTSTRTALSFKIVGVESAEKYVVEYATDSAFSDARSKTYVSAGSKTITGLTSGTTYYLRLKAISSEYPDSDYSEIYQTTLVGSTLPTPIVSYSATSNAITLSVETVQGAESYVVEYSRFEDYFNSNAETFAAAGSHTISGLVFGSVYYFRVKATASNALDSQWFEFSCAAGQLPSTSATVVAVARNSITLDTETISSAAGYAVEAATNPEFDDSMIWVFETAGEQTISDLLPETTYYLRVKALGDDESIVDSAWSDFFVATTTAIQRLPVPTISGITAQRNSIVVKIDPLEGASRYVVEYGTDSSFATASSKEYSTPGVKTIMGLSPGTSYFVRIMAKSLELEDSVWSETYETRTSDPEIVPLPAPTIAGSVTNVAIVVKIDPVEGADKYVLEYDANANFTSPKSKTYASGGVKTISGLTTGTAYFVRVKAIAPDREDSSWSSLRLIPGATILPTPKLAASATKTAVIVNIGAVESADSYVLEYGTRADFSDAITKTYATSGAKTFSGLPFGTTYYFRVRATAASFNDSKPAEVAFAAGRLSETTLKITSVNYDRVELTLTKVANAVGYAVEYSKNSDLSDSKYASFATFGTKTIVGLDPSSTYYFRAKALGDGTNRVDSAWTSTISKRTSAYLGALETPPLVVSTTKTALVFKLSSVSNATKYVLEFGTDPTFSKCSTKVYSTVGSKTISGLTSGTTYYLRLKATATGFSDSNWFELTATTKSGSSSALLDDALIDEFDGLEEFWDVLAKSAAPSRNG